MAEPGGEPDAAPPDIRGALDLPPEDAQRAFRARDEFRFSVSWRDLRPEEHARAFTAAKIARLDLLADLKESLDQALTQGQTFEQWRDGIAPTLQQKGWWGMVTDRSITGTDRPVFVGERRLRTIFETNMRVSRAAGRWARIQAAKGERPWLRYVAVMDRRTRPLHRRWHGLIRPVDDPIWNTLYPPNGWNCRCQVQQLSDDDLRRRGLSPTPDSGLPPLDPVGRVPFGIPRRDRLTTPGIDPGWNYNPGAASLAGLLDKAAASVARAEAAGLSDAAGVTRNLIRALLAGLVADELLDALLPPAEGESA
jgi:SPP1 gp7 family putative phage head morphogenesis protein